MFHHISQIFYENVYCFFLQPSSCEICFAFSAIHIVEDFWLKPVCGRFLCNPVVAGFFVQSRCCEIFCAIQLVGVEELRFLSLGTDEDAVRQGHPHANTHKDIQHLHV